MTHPPKDPREDIDILIQTASEYGYTITETSRQNGTIKLDITRNPDVFEFTAVFGHADNSTFWSFNVGYDHRDGGAHEILLLEKLTGLIEVRA